MPKVELFLVVAPNVPAAFVPMKFPASRFPVASSDPRWMACHML
jgi:hypothetical protein